MRKAACDRNIEIARPEINPALEIQFHAELLKRMNRPEEAQAKLEEAAKL